MAFSPPSGCLSHKRLGYNLRYNFWYNFEFQKFGMYICLLGSLPRTLTIFWIPALKVYNATTRHCHISFCIQNRILSFLLFEALQKKHLFFFFPEEVKKERHKKYCKKNRQEIFVLFFFGETRVIRRASSTSLTDELFKHSKRERVFFTKKQILPKNKQTKNIKK